MKLIVTHLSPDLDASTSCWLLKKYLLNFSDSEIIFVPAGTTYKNIDPDIDKNIIHVDTGKGKLDHHQLTTKTSASKLVYKFLRTKNLVPEKDLEAVNKIISYVTEIDNFQEVYYPNPNWDIYDLLPHQLITGLKHKLNDDSSLIEYIFILLDSILQVFKNKLAANKEIEKGYVFKTIFGKSLALETKMKGISKFALKMGYKLVIRKDINDSSISIKSFPQDKYDLTPFYTVLKKMDKKASWFFHSSKHILSNGSPKNPTFQPSNIPLKKIIELAKKV